MPRKFSIAYDPCFAPISHVDGEGKAAGLCVEPVAEALRMAGIDHEFVPTALPFILPQLETGAVDAVAALAVTRERAAVLEFSSPLLRSGGAWFSTAPFRPSAKGRVATPEAGPLAKWLMEHCPHINVDPVADYAAALNAVLSGFADAAALNFHVGRHWCDTRHAGKFALPEEPFMSVDLALACRRGAGRPLIDALADRAARRLDSRLASKQ